MTHVYVVNGRVVACKLGRCLDVFKCWEVVGHIYNGKSVSLDISRGLRRIELTYLVRSG